MRLRQAFVPCLAILILAYAMLVKAQRGGGPMTMPPEPGSLPAHRFEKVTEGVYYSTATGSVTIGSNSVVIVNEDDVMVVDPGIAAAAATTLIADVKTSTNKPIKYVVDTHYHYDHAFGSQVFGPDVTVIGHDTTRRRLSDPGSLKSARTWTTAPRRSPIASPCSSSRFPKRGIRRRRRSSSGNSPSTSNTRTSRQSCG